jgi:hypothetical protein
MAYTADGRVIKFGLCPGSADLIGFKSVEITPDMVGKRVAIFYAVEQKKPGGKTSDGQKKWLDMCEKHGAITEITLE